MVKTWWLTGKCWLKSNWGDIMIMDGWLIREILLQGEMERLRCCIKVSWRGLFEIELWFDDLDIIDWLWSND